MAKNKPNTMLAKRDAQLNEVYRQKLEIGFEFDLIALMKTVHEELYVGPGRARQVLDAFLENRMEIAHRIEEDYGPDKHTGDKEILYTKKMYADLLRSVFSPEDWKRVRTLFPLLRQYWED